MMSSLVAGTVNVIQPAVQNQYDTATLECCKQLSLISFSCHSHSCLLNFRNQVMLCRKLSREQRVTNDSRKKAKSTKQGRYSLDSQSGQGNTNGFCSTAKKFRSPEKYQTHLKYICGSASVDFASVDLAQPGEVEPSRGADNLEGFPGPQNALYGI